MKNFSYLLGAGASAQTIAIVSRFGKSLRDLYDKYKSLNYATFTLTVDQKNNFDVLLDDIKWLYEKSENFYSIDTLAKQLYLTNNIEDLKRLKRTLSSYLTLIQGVRLHDMRYDLFFATLLSTNGNSLNSLPSNIKILSWNYDYQVELSIAQFLPNYKYTHEIETFTNSYPCRHQYPYRTFSEMLNFLSTTNVNGQFIPNGFSLFKLNGTAGGFIHNDTFVDRDISKFNSEIDFTELTDSLIKRTVDNHDIYKIQSEPSINFAWENDHIAKCTRVIAKESTKDTDVLVVIGYSFPTFNREIDREIINNMTKLKKIYFQIPEQYIEGVIQRFRAIKENPEIEIERITNCDEFFIPYEF